MQPVVSLPAKSQASEVVLPAQRSLDHVTKGAQPTAMFRVLPSKLRLNVTLTQPITMRLRVVSPVTVEFARAAPRPTHFAGNRRNRLHQWLELRDIVLVGPGQRVRKGNAAGIGQHVMLAASSRTVDRTRAGARPPFNARTEALSIAAREKSI